MQKNFALLQTGMSLVPHHWMEHVCLCAHAHTDTQFWTRLTITELISRVDHWKYAIFQSKNLFTQNMLLTFMHSLVCICSYQIPKSNSTLIKHMVSSWSCWPEKRCVAALWCVCKMNGNGHFYVLFSSQSLSFSLSNALTLWCLFVCLFSVNDCWCIYLLHINSVYKSESYVYLCKSLLSLYSTGVHLHDACTKGCCHDFND